jgi:hypothetical protein
VSNAEATETESMEAALRARLVDVQCRIDRWTTLAAAAQDLAEQERCRKAAEEAQSEARKLRQELAAAIAALRRPRWFDRWTRRRTGLR